VEVIAVASIVIEAGGSCDQAIEPLLHDSIWDHCEHYTGGVSALRCIVLELFAPNALASVEACTDSPMASAAPWR